MRERLRARELTLVGGRLPAAGDGDRLVGAPAQGKRLGHGDRGAEAGTFRRLVRDARGGVESSRGIAVGHREVGAQGKQLGWLADVGVQSLRGGVGSAQPPEEVAGAREGQRHALFVPVRGEPREQPLGLLSRARGRHRVHESRREPAPGLQRRAGEARGGLVVVRVERLARRAFEQFGPGAGLEPPAREADRVAAAARPGRLDGVGQAPLERLLVRRAHDLPVQRVGQLGEAAAPVAAQHDEAVADQVAQRRELVLAEQPQLDGHADSHELERGQRRGRERVETGTDDLLQPWPRARTGVPAPDAVLLAQRAVLDRATHELAHEQEVAARQAPDRSGAATIDWPTQSRRQQRLDARGVERLEREERAHVVLPQRLQRVRRGLLAPHGHHRARLTGVDELMQERGRRVVERVGIVDEEHEAPATGPLAQRVPRAHERLAAARIEHGRERPERDRGRRRRRPDPHDIQSGELRRGLRLSEQPRLAGALDAGNHHAAGARIDERLAQQRQLPVTPGDRPSRATSRHARDDVRDGAGHSPS